MIRRPPSSPLFPYTPLSRSPHPRLDFRLRERGARLRYQQIHRVVDARGERTIPTLVGGARVQCPLQVAVGGRAIGPPPPDLEPKSTRLNSSHSPNSDARLCV